MSGAVGFLVGAAAGALSGFGVGGGTLLLLWLTTLGGMDQRQAGGVNLFYFIVCAIPALIGHAKNGLLDKPAIKSCALAGAPVCVGAALLAAGMDLALLRRVFGVFLLAVGARELFAKGETETRRIKGGRTGTLGEDHEKEESK